MTREVLVDLGDRSYLIRIQPGLLADVGRVCHELGLTSTALVVSDDNVGVLYGDACVESLTLSGIHAVRATVPAGEPSKCLKQLSELYDRAVEVGLDRKSFVVALGGGVVGDLAGYLAASYLRGIAYVQVPTTLVAMVDSAVGGKTGINLPQGKNLVGSFWQPSTVCTDLSLLDSLPPREYISGLAEVIKYGVIWDAELFDLLEQRRDELVHRDPSLIGKVVARSCAIKADVVRRDEREGGLRAILNFGHTVGHAIEKVAAYGTYLHGEAISIGMVYAAKLSVNQAGFSAFDSDRIETLLKTYGLPTCATGCAWKDIRMAICVDKKTADQTPRFVLANRIGQVVFDCEVKETDLKSVWLSLR